MYTYMCKTHIDENSSLYFIYIHYNLLKFLENVVYNAPK